MKKQSGFTLIELAIVLVIIGLLLGGVLKGQELITQGKIKNVIADFNGITAAYYGYQDRYKAIPGDDPNSGTRWSLTALTGTGHGNGDGQLDSATPGTYNQNIAAPTATDGTQETSLFWRDLRLSGFVGGTGGSNPNNAVAGLVGVQQGNDLLKSTAAATAGTGFTGLIICSSNIPDKIAVAIDTTLDDGNPQTGSVRAVVQLAPNPTMVVGGFGDKAEALPYSETGGKQYLVCKSL
ncbi:MAG TPA: prepilin-type N-terminal cleavage/methylation domain-containing protein [Methylophilaceae bacterium]